MNDQKMLIGYYRLSLEDGSAGESNSIINQRKLVKDYISHIPELAELPFQKELGDLLFLNLEKILRLFRGDKNRLIKTHSQIKK